MEEHNSDDGGQVDGQDVGVKGLSAKHLIYQPPDQTGSGGVNERVGNDGEAGALLGRVQELQEGDTVLYEPVENWGAREEEQRVAKEPVSFLQKRRKVVILFTGEVNRVVPASGPLGKVSRGTVVNLVFLAPVDWSDNNKLGQEFAQLIPLRIGEERTVAAIMKDHEHVKQAQRVEYDEQEKGQYSHRVKGEATNPLAERNCYLLESQSVIWLVFRNMCTQCGTVVLLHAE